VRVQVMDNVKRSLLGRERDGLETLGWDPERGVGWLRLSLPCDGCFAPFCYMLSPRILVKPGRKSSMSVRVFMDEYGYPIIRNPEICSDNPARR